MVLRRFNRRCLSLLLLMSLSSFFTITIYNVMNLGDPASQTENAHESIFLESVLVNAPATTDLEKNIPSLPLEFWRNRKRSRFHRTMKKNGNCTDLPDIFDIHYNNIHWQELEINGTVFYFYAAYYDNRLIEKDSGLVRILTMIDAVEPKLNLFCNIWFSESERPVTVKVEENFNIWNKKWKVETRVKYEPHLMTCKIPKNYGYAIPSAVSVIGSNCTKVTNFLKVIFYKEVPKRNFAVCVKGLDLLHKDISFRMVEWLELLKILGADQVFFYSLSVHPNILKVLDFYESEGFVDVTPINFPGVQPNAPFLQHYYMTRIVGQKRHNELLPYNDCLYKNLNSFNYIAVLDIDEVIIPMRVDNWEKLINVVRSESLSKGVEVASFRARNTYFFDDEEVAVTNEVPSYMHMLKYFLRTKDHSPEHQYAKCFHDTQRVVSIHNHVPLSCLNGSCVKYTIDVSDAQLQHYRSDCVKGLKKVCGVLKSNRVRDTTILKYKNELIFSTKNALTKLGFLVDSDNVISEQ